MLTEKEARKKAREMIKEASKSEDKLVREMATEILKREEERINGATRSGK